MKIFLVRHTSVDVPKGICYGVTDVPLNKTFIDEAVEVKRRLVGLTFEAVFTSPLTRAVRLAEFCGFMNAEVDSRLREFDFGEWEMKDYNILYETDKRFSEWCDNFITSRAPGGESFEDQMARFDSFVCDMKKRGYERICAFCHGGVLACALIRSGQVKVNEAFSCVPPYGSVIEVDL